MTNTTYDSQEIKDAKAGDLFYCQKTSAIAGFDNDDVFVKSDDILVYLGLKNRAKDNYECHVFFHQNSTKYIGWTVVALHYFDEYIKRCV